MPAHHRGGAAPRARAQTAHGGARARHARRRAAGQPHHHHGRHAPHAAHAGHTGQRRLQLAGATGTGSGRHHGRRAKSVGQYLLGKTIGQGTFGRVKLGSHLLTGEKVAIKILEKERIVDVPDVERVTREIKILKRNRHHNIVQLFEVIDTPTTIYLIMENCDGGELFDYIVAHQRVQEREACRFFHQIVDGVEYLHRMEVTHRDLKPENLLMQIVDFGLSNTTDGGRLLKTACGSPCYAAPEMIAGKQYVGAKADIWSLGVILFALVCGYLPFEDSNTSVLYKKILAGKYQCPRNISPEVRDLIGRILNTDPAKRYDIDQIRQHPWYRQVTTPPPREPIVQENEQIDERVLQQLTEIGIDAQEVSDGVSRRQHNPSTAAYYLLLNRQKRQEERAAARAARQPGPGRHAAAASVHADGSQTARDRPDPLVSPRPATSASPPRGAAAAAAAAGGRRPAPVARPRRPGSSMGPAVAADPAAAGAPRRPAVPRRPGTSGGGTVPRRPETSRHAPPQRPQSQAAGRRHRHLVQGSRAAPPTVAAERPRTGYQRPGGAAPAPAAAAVEGRAATRHQPVPVAPLQLGWGTAQRGNEPPPSLPPRIARRPVPTAPQTARAAPRPGTADATTTRLPASSGGGGAPPAGMEAVRGGFDVSSTSSRSPKELITEVMRALTAARVSFKPSGPYSFRCVQNGIRFEMEVSRVDRIQKLYVVTLRRHAGEAWAYKALADRLLEAMKLH